MVVYDLSTNWKKGMQDDAEIGLDCTRSLNELATLTPMSYVHTMPLCYNIIIFDFFLGQGVCGRFKMATAPN